MNESRYLWNIVQVRDDLARTVAATNIGDSWEIVDRNGDIVIALERVVPHKIVVHIERDER